ncbi:MAG TPA: thiamine biosynthesis protein ThiF, partial [Phycisphaerales bacterium]|nr:thiamine biosynthesis protein ThiF [Phycisphaerales bacterium]
GASPDGHHLLNRLATYYQIPYFDVGVKLEADGKGNISQICGSVNYLQSGKSSLLSRNVITLDGIEAEGMMRTNPALYEKQYKEKYIKGVNVDSPAVISINMHYASMAVIEFLARIHQFRDDDNNRFAQFGSSLTQSRIYYSSDFEKCVVLAKHVGKGDRTPLLDMPTLSD